MRYNAALITDKPVDPVQYAYKAHLMGQNIQSLRMAGMVKTYVQHREMSIIGQMCEKLNHIAIASRRLTRRQRIKYAAQRISAGRSVYYVFPRFLPADVGAAIKTEKDVFVYD